MFIFSKRLAATFLALALLLLSLNTALAAAVETTISNDAIQLDVDSHLKSTSNIFVNAGVLYSEEYSANSSLVGKVGIQGVETDNATYRASVGANFYAYDFGKINGSAVAFGGQFYHVIPGMQRFSAGGFAWYSPKITSFGDTERLYEIGVRAAYRVIQNTDVFVGYRHLQVKNKKTGFNDPLEKGLHLGFRLNF